MQAKRLGVVFLNSNRRSGGVPVAGKPNEISKPVLAATAVACLALAQGCASYVPARQDSPLADQLDVGDRVRVVTNDGAKRNFTVTRIDRDGLQGDSDYLKFIEISTMEISKRTTGESPSAGVVALTVLGVILILDALGVGDAD